MHSPEGIQSRVEEEEKEKKKKKVEHDWVDLLSDGAEEEDGGGRKRSGGSGIEKVRAAKCRSGTQTCGSNILPPRRCAKR